MLVLNQYLLPYTVSSEPPTTASILLDLDLFKAHELPQNEASLWSLLEELHCKKNEIFEGCITDRTRDLIR